MGTRNLTMVIHNGEAKVAQYGQWDGYPSGQGTTILEFLKKTDLDHFKKQLTLVKFTDEAKQKEISEWLESIGAKGGWMNDDQAKQYHVKYPLLTRDHGAGVLELIDALEGGENWLHNQENFAGDSLFCEWAYVIDLDKGKLEVYKGFNKKPLGKRARFKKFEADMKAGDDKYYPVVKTATFDIYNLPTDSAEFEAKCYHKKYTQKVEEPGAIVVTAIAGEIAK